MSEPITPAISDRICKHMNDDHGDALVLYAKAFGNTPQAESAQLISIDPQGMNLSVQIGGETSPLRIEFDRELKDAEDAHYKLIDMVKQARQNRNYAP
jgi:putative heme iron utilization protein